MLINNSKIKKNVFLNLQLTFPVKFSKVIAFQGNFRENLTYVGEGWVREILHGGKGGGVINGQKRPYVINGWPLTHRQMEKQTTF